MRVEHVLVHAQHERRVGILRRRAMMMTCLGSGGQMFAPRLLVGKAAGRLDDHIHAERFPGEFLGIFNGEHFDVFAVE